MQGLPKAILKRVQESQWREASQAEISRRLLKKMRSRHILLGTARLDDTVAELFSTAAIASETEKLIDEEEHEEPHHLAVVDDGSTVIAIAEEAVGERDSKQEDGIRRRRGQNAEDASVFASNSNTEEVPASNGDEIIQDQSSEAAKKSLCLSLMTLISSKFINKLESATCKYAVLWTHPSLIAMRGETSAGDIPSPDDDPVGLLVQMHRFCLLRTHWVCYMLIITAALVNRDFFAVILPMIMFGWGTLQRPLATDRFWTFVLVYSCTLLIVRYIFQFVFWGAFNAPVDPCDNCANSYLLPGCLTFARFAGIGRESDGPHVLRLLVPDLLLVISLGMYRSVLQLLGIWG